MTPTRRSLITGLVSLIAAPAIVRAESLMKVRGIVMAAPVHTGTEYVITGIFQASECGGPVIRICAARLNGQDPIAWETRPPGPYAVGDTFSLRSGISRALTQP